MKLKSETEIWERVETALGIEIDPGIRRYFKRKRYIKGIINEADTITNLKKDVRDLLECLGYLEGSAQGIKGRRNQQSSDITADRRLSVVSEIWADAENENPSVKAFRNEHLNGKTLQSADDADKWLDIQAFGKEGWYWDKQPGVLGPSWDTEMQHPVFESYDPRWRIETAEPDSVLDQLRQLADGLSSRSPWSKGQAVWFILTGQPPQMYMLASTVSYKRYKGSEGWEVWGTIHLHISPRTSPEEVLRVYREMRKRMLANERDRDLSEKQLRLLEFVRKNNDKYGDELHIEWNDRYPDDTFEQYETFFQAFNRANGKLSPKDMRHPFFEQTWEDYQRLIHGIMNRDIDAPHGTTIEGSEPL